MVGMRNDAVDQPRGGNYRPILAPQQLRATLRQLDVMERVGGVVVWPSPLSSWLAGAALRQVVSQFNLRLLPERVYWR